MQLIFVVVAALPDCSYTTAKPDVTVVAMDDILFSRSANDCQRFCDDARAFNCRSYAQKADRYGFDGRDLFKKNKNKKKPL